MEYRGFIFTKHALERLDKRGVTKDMVVQVLQSPSETKPTGKRNTTKFIKIVHDRLVHVVATHLPQENKWLVVSVWVRGEEDEASLAWRILTVPFKAIWYLIKRFVLHT